MNVQRLLRDERSAFTSTRKKKLKKKRKRKRRKRILNSTFASNNLTPTTATTSNETNLKSKSNIASCYNNSSSSVVAVVVKQALSEKLTNARLSVLIFAAMSLLQLLNNNSAILLQCATQTTDNIELSYTNSTPVVDGSNSRIHAIAGQLLELKCPLLFASSSSKQKNNARIAWRKQSADGASWQLVDALLDHRISFSARNESLVIARSEPMRDSGKYECLSTSNAKLLDDFLLMTNSNSNSLLISYAVATTTTTNNDDDNKDNEDSSNSNPSSMFRSLLFGQSNSNSAKSSKQLISKHVFNVRVLIAPKVLPFEFPAFAVVNAKVSLICSVLEGEQPITFTWFKNNELISNNNSTTTTNSSNIIIGNLTNNNYVRITQADEYSILSIDKLSLQHSGKYTCKAQNEVAQAQHSSTLTVNEPPSFDVEPKDVSVVAGQTAILDCKARGVPAPTQTWLRQQRKDKTFELIAVRIDSHKYWLAANNSLRIVNATQRDAGRYMCLANNGFRPELAKFAQLTVRQPPSFLPFRERIHEARNGQQTSIECAPSVGETPIQLRWLDARSSLHSTFATEIRAPTDLNFKESNASNILQQQQQQQQQLQSDNRFSVSFNAINSSLIATTLNVELAEQTTTTTTTTTTAILHIKALEMRDSGKFVCEARNEFGFDSLTVHLRVTDLPAKVIGLTATEVNNSSLTLHWQLPFDNNAPLTGHLVQYQADELDISNDNSNTNSSSSSSESMQAVDVVAATTTTTITTNGLQVESYQDATSLDSPSLLSALTVDDADKTLVELAVNRTEPSVELRGLSAYCAYKIRVAALNKLGVGAFSEWMRVKTAESTPSGAPLKLSAVATGPNSVKLSWIPPNHRKWNGQLVAFKIGFRPIDSLVELNKTIEWSTPVQLADQLAFKTTQTSRALSTLLREPIIAHLTNLQRSTTYLCWLHAVNKQGVGPQSHVVPVKTLDDVPPSAPTLRIQSATTHSLTLAWSLASNFVSPANQYTIFYRRLTRALQTQQPATIDSTFSNSFNSQHQQQQHFSANNEQHFLEQTVGSEQLLTSSNNNGFAAATTTDSLPQVAFARRQMQMQPQLVTSQQQHQFVYTLEKLDCGAEYELYMTTRNSVGKSEPSSVIVGRTIGEPPRAPSVSSLFFARLATTEVLLNLAAWQTGGCALSSMTLRFVQTSLVTAASNDELTLNTQQQQQHQHPAITVSVPNNLLAAIGKQSALFNEDNSNSNNQLTASSDLTSFALKGLLPATSYALQVSSLNSAGKTVASYEFATAGLNASQRGFAISESERARQQHSSHLSSRMLAEFANSNNINNNDVKTLNADSTTQLQFVDAFSVAHVQLLPLAFVAACCVLMVVSSAFCCSRLTNNELNVSRSSNTSTDSGGSSNSSNAATINKRNKQLLTNRLLLANNSSRQQASINNLHSTASYACNAGSQQHSASLIVAKDSPWQLTNNNGEFVDEQANHRQRLFASKFNDAELEHQGNNSGRELSNFSQSVSMRDFADLTRAQTTTAAPTTTAAAVATSTATVRRQLRNASNNQSREHAATLSFGAQIRSQRKQANGDNFKSSRTLRLGSMQATCDNNFASTNVNATYDDAMFDAASQLYSFQANAQQQHLRQQQQQQIYCPIKSTAFVDAAAPINNQSLSEVLAAAVAAQQKSTQQTTQHSQLLMNGGSSSSTDGSGGVEQGALEFATRDLHHHQQQQHYRALGENYAIPNHLHANSIDNGAQMSLLAAAAAVAAAADERNQFGQNFCTNSQYDAVQQLLTSPSASSEATSAANCVNKQQDAANCQDASPASQQLYAAINAARYSSSSSSAASNKRHNSSQGFVCATSTSQSTPAVDSSSSSSGIDVSQHTVNDNCSLVDANGLAASVCGSSNHHQHAANTSLVDNSNLTPPISTNFFDIDSINSQHLMAFQQQQHNIQQLLDDNQYSHQHQSNNN